MQYALESIIKISIRYAQIAQSVEQKTENLRVGGSIPPLGTILKQRPISGRFLLKEKHDRFNT